MLAFESAGLTITLLDPEASVARLGPRYCSGGYIWQVTDARHGALFAGPRFPDPEPPPFDGQGLPEVFETALGADTAGVGDDVWVIGVGRVRRESPVHPFHVRNNPTVVERAKWSAELGKTSVVMRSDEAFAGFELALVREVSLRTRLLTSKTTLHNRGKRALPVRWFAHPFFPWAGAECSRFSAETTLPENPGFRMSPHGFVERHPEHAWHEGCYVVPQTELGRELRITQKHPTLGEVTVACQFPLARLALWGNDRTVSPEPFYAKELPPGATTEWAVSYAL